MADPSPEDEQAQPPADPQPVQPLNISGVVVTKRQLLDALRVYVPTITDFSALPDGEHFYLLFGGDGQPAVH